LFFNSFTFENFQICAGFDMSTDFKSSSERQSISRKSLGKPREMPSHVASAIATNSPF
jgi:hypothetical protein